MNGKRITFTRGRRRTKSQFMGRFGGGWDWKIGITASSWSPRHGMTIMVAYLVDECRIVIRPKAAVTP